jgi:hypothetical protein
MLTNGTEYVDQGQDCSEQRYRFRVLANLSKAAPVDFRLQPVVTPEAA